MKLQAYLVDDEQLALDRLRRLLEEKGNVDIVGSTTEPEQACLALTEQVPDVCFLDIQMPQMDGFELLRRIPVQPLVVFTTAYDRYALQAFDVNSIDYLLKPIERRQLDRALEKVGRWRAEPGEYRAVLRAAIEKLAGPPKREREYPDRIASRTGDRLSFLDLANVTHFYAEHKLTYAVSRGKPFCVDYSIIELESKLDPKRFFRIHRSTLVNLTWVRDLSPLPGGSWSARLLDGTTDLVVARDRAREFKQVLGA